MKSTRLRFPLFVFAAIWICGISASPRVTQAQTDYPQWGGPNRDHKSSETGLLREWPEGGPKLAWKFADAGKGYSSFSVVDGQLFTLGTVDASTYAICVDTSSGEEVWRTELEAEATGYNTSWAGGPRSTPTVVGDNVFVLADGGTLACLSRGDGQMRWSTHLVKDHGGKVPTWGYSESPLVDGDRVVVCPGVEKFLVAFDVQTGKEVLVSSGYDERAHYVSIVKAKIGSISMYITATREGLVGFDAKTGDKLWTNGSSGNGTATIPTPIVSGNLVYHTSDYGTGCVLVELTQVGDTVEAKEIYASKNMQNHHGGVVLLENSIFGLKKGGGWVCHDFMTGEVRWNHRLRGDGSASVCFADNRFYIFGENTGTCYLVEPSEEDWLERGKLKLPEETEIDRQRGKIWAHPVIADGKLFLRDMDLIFAFDVRDN